MGVVHHSVTVEDLQPRPPKMMSTKIVIALIVAVQFASLVDGMGLCFGGYPACCQGGKNTCGPFCASCSRVGEFLMHMMMFDPMGFGRGTPNVFRLINPDPHAFPDKDPFPGRPLAGLRSGPVAVQCDPWQWTRYCGHPGTSAVARFPENYGPTILATEQRRVSVHQIPT